MRLIKLLSEVGDVISCSKSEDADWFEVQFLKAKKINQKDFFLFDWMVREGRNLIAHPSGLQKKDAQQGFDFLVGSSKNEAVKTIADLIVDEMFPKES